jgi:PIN domain nuclease of toxin-antitoxin system
VAASVLDASALLAFMQDGRGAEMVAEALRDGCAISVVNLSEVLSQIADDGGSVEETLANLERLGDALEWCPVERQDMLEIARLRPLTRFGSLSLGDRTCLALATRLGLPVITADPSWRHVPAEDIEVTLIR